MSIEVTCPQCGTLHQVNERLIGRRVRCPHCEFAVEVPEPVLARKQLQNLTTDMTATTSRSTPPLSLGNSFDSRKLGVRDDGVTLDSTPSLRTQDDAIAFAEADDDEEDPVLPRRMRPEEEMDMTPMVDVTFLLLIFFMVTAAFSLQKSIEMPRQQTDAPSTAVIEEEIEELDMVEVQIDEFGSFLVMAPEWERETPGKLNLISTLREAIAGTNDGMRLVVKVHELAKLHALVDAMDAGTIAGFTQLEVTQVEEFD